jgi:hypothetical protein
MDLSEIAPILVKTIQEALEQKRYPFGMPNQKGRGNKIASGTLYNSVQATVRDAGNRDIIEISMAEYGQWVQSGRLPGKRKIPVSVIERWITQRKLKGRDKKGKYIKNKSLAFAIQQNIFKFGIRPSNFLDIAFDNLVKNEEVINLIADATIEDLINAIEGI